MADLLFHMEPPVLPSHERRDFDGFYRLYCRADPGARTRAAALREAYLRYAMALGLHGLSFREMRSAMILRGHDRILSNGSVYLGVRLLSAAEVPGLPDQPPVPVAPLPLDIINAQIDRVAAELRMLRRLIREHGCEQTLALEKSDDEPKQSD